MPDSRQLDARELKPLDLPFDSLAGELQDPPRIVAGQNVWIPVNGKPRKRPALRSSDFTGYGFPANHRIDNLTVYETLEDTPKRYILASAYDTINAHWNLYYIRLDAGAPAWTLVTDLRELQSSSRVHEIVVANGLAYIKGYPTGTEKLGSVIFDGTDASTTIWGLLPPSTAAQVTSSAGWTASTNPTTVTFGWMYSYSYKTKSGHISSRAPVEVPTGNGVASPSDTGAFTNLQPQVEVQGTADTTNIPTIVIWRTTDGGSNFLKLDEITNTGAGTITYTDNKRTGSVTNDPKTDFEINTFDFAPSTTSNDPPPTVLAPQVVGTDTPRKTTPFAEYANRIWFGLANYLFFSGQEEIINGVPWESWPSGTSGNFVQFKQPIRHLIPTNEALYVITEDSIKWVRGTDRGSFRVENLLSGIGSSSYVRSVTVFGDSILFLSRDGQVFNLQGRNIRAISPPVESELESYIANADEVFIDAHQTKQIDWVAVTLVDRGTPSNSRTLVYDAVRGKWNTPWIAPITAQTSGVIRESSTTRKMVVATWEGTQAYVGVLDDSSNVDQLKATPAAFAWDFTLALSANPEGNHINALRAPAAVPRLDYFKVQRTKYASDTAPTVEYRSDFTGSYTTMTRADAPFETQKTGYNEDWYALAEAHSRVQIKLSKSAADENVELQSLAYVWHPEAGV